MAKRPRTPEELAQRPELAKEFKEFRKEFKFTQKKLSDVIGKGLSRRTIQMIESGQDNPHPDTLDRFRELVAKHKSGKKRSTTVDFDEEE